MEPSVVFQPMIVFWHGHMVN